MIRKLTEADREPLLALLGAEAALNLFIIGDVENFGFEQDFMEVWGETEDEDGPLKAVLLRYYTSYLPYAHGPFDTDGFAAIVRANRKAEMLSGSTEVVQAFADKLAVSNHKQLYFSELKAMTESIANAEPLAAAQVKKASVDDVENICTLTDLIEEFSANPDSTRRGMRQALSTGTGRTYFAEHDGKVIATASTSAENSLSAMIIGVATHPGHRGQGLARLLVARLCADLLAEGKSLCLFYDNPKAARIYESLGFQRIGSWSMMDLQQEA